MYEDVWGSGVQGVIIATNHAPQCYNWTMAKSTPNLPDMRKCFERSLATSIASIDDDDQRLPG